MDLSELDQRIVQEQEEIQRNMDAAGQEELDLQNEAENASFFQHLKDGLQDNALYRGVKFTVRNSMFTDDPEFDPQVGAAHLLKELPAEYHDGILQSGSMAEASSAAIDAHETYRARQRIERSTGTSPVVAHLISGLLDADTIAMLPFAAGKGVAGAAKAGAVSMGIDTAVLANTAPEYGLADIAPAMLSGAAFGGVIGAVTPNTAKMQDTLNAHAETIKTTYKNASSTTWDALHPQNVAKASPSFSTKAEEYSVGAMQSPDSTLYAKDFSLHPMVQGYMRAASEAIEKIDIPTHPFKPDKLTSRLGELIYNVHGRTPLASPFQQLWESDSDVAKMFAYHTLESNVGVVRNNNSSAMLTPYYRNQISSTVMLNYDNTVLEFLDETVGKKYSNQVTQTVASTLLSDTHRQAFHKRVIAEMQARRFDGPLYVPDSSKAVQKMAERIQNGFRAAHKIGVGADGQIPIKGFKELNPDSMGWFQKWDGSKMNKLMMERAVTQKQIIKALETQYKLQFPDWEPKFHKNLAAAVVRRAEMNRLSGDTNIYRLLDEDGIDYAISFLVEAGIPEQEATKMISTLKGKTPDQGSPSILKQRHDIDLRQKIEGTAYTLMDLVDTDIPKAWGAYANKVGGLAALARKDIQYADRKNLIDAIVISSNGKVTKEYMEDIFNSFTGDPVRGGVHPDMHRALTATHLSVLNNSGLIQTMEYAPVAASTTLDNLFKSIKQGVAIQTGKPFSKVMKDIGKYLPSIYGEHKLFRPELFLEEISKTPSALNPFREFTDKLLRKGVSIQRVTNGMAMVMHNQHAAGVHALLHDLNDVFRGKTTRWSRERLYDIGLDDKLVQKLKTYWDNGTVKQLPEGDIDLGLDSWHPHDIEHLSLALLRNSMQMVQREAIGEAPHVYGGTMGAFLFALKKFTLGSITKQTVRSLKHGDIQSLMGFIYGVGLAGSIYTGSQLLKGKSDKVNMKDSALGALSYAGQTGWIPMMYDPLAVAIGNPIANLAGFDADLTIGKGGGKGLQQDVLATPTVLSVGNKLLRLPMAAPRAMLGQADSQDRAAIAVMPLIGNHTFFAGALNAITSED